MITTARNILREGYEVGPMRGRAGAGREPLTALLLAGGRSSRMGRNKALLSLRPGGPPVIQLIAHKMAEVADEMLLVGCDPRPYAFLGLPCVPDAFPGTGPLGGVYSGLAAARNPYALAVACDMPFLSVDLLKVYGIPSPGL